MTLQILVVDDSTTIRLLVQQALVHAGFEVTLAADGREALELASAAPPALMLVDFVMPVMNGFQLCQHLRASPALRDIPVVLMSAKAERIGASFLAQTGAVAALSKPFTPSTLLATVAHAAAMAKARREGLAKGERPPDELVAPQDEPAEPVLDETLEAAYAEAAGEIALRIAELVSTTLVDANLTADEAARGLLSAHQPRALSAFVCELAELVPAMRGEVSLTARTRDVPLGDLLQMLSQQLQTGMIVIERTTHEHPARILVCMSEGYVDIALGRELGHEFSLGRYLRAQRTVPEAQLEEVLQNRAVPRRLLGAELIERGHLTFDGLRRALAAQSSELVYEALRWRDAEVRFVRLATRPEATEARLRLPIGPLVMDGARRVDEWKVIEAQLRSLEAPIRLDEAAFEAARATMSEELRRVAGALDGRRGARAIADHLGMSAFDAAKALVELRRGRVIVLAPE